MYKIIISIDYYITLNAIFILNNLIIQTKNKGCSFLQPLFLNLSSFMTYHFSTVFTLVLSTYEPFCKHLFYFLFLLQALWFIPWHVLFIFPFLFILNLFWLPLWVFIFGIFIPSWIYFFTFKGLVNYHYFIFYFTFIYILTIF